MAFWLPGDWRETRTREDLIEKKKKNYEKLLCYFKICFYCENEPKVLYFIYFFSRDNPLL